jgi:O-methyltransferase
MLSSGQQVWTFQRAVARSVRYRLLARGLDLVPIMDRKSHLAIVREVMRESGLAMNGCEGYQLLATVTAAVGKLAGDLAEVGVNRGGSAKLICEAKGSRDLHLFDTFAGLPPPGDHDRGTVFWEGQFAATQESVQRYLARYPNVHFHKGLFPATADPIMNLQFCFVHLDVDFYEGTRAGLEIFYPRMVPGGVLMSHDYDAAGVRRAVDEFFADKPEIVIQQPAGSHCIAIKAAA